MTFTRKMKKLLITSAVLAAVGIIICLVGFITAKGNDTPLFNQTQNEDGNYVYVHEFDYESVKKISAELSYANVNIIGGAESNKIEMINFPIDEFSLTVGATTVSIEERSGLGSLFSFNFSGFRNYLNSVKMALKEKTVNIYLTDSSAIKLLDIEIYSGNANVSGVRNDTDIVFDIGYGSLLIEDIKSAGGLDVKIREGNLDMKNSELYSHKSELLYGYEYIEDSALTEINSDIKKGYFKYKTSKNDLLSGVLRLKTDNGRVRFGGDIYENGSFSQGMEYVGVSGVVQTIIEVHVSDGNIMITE
ncbi:MAG: hypothetical protein E7623_07310 [Ruminococcaceae bacterium]|nr:hypothetical protein [Oscillospiraceae bacterium]